MLLASWNAAAQECNYASPVYYPDRFVEIGPGVIRDRATGLSW